MSSSAAHIVALADSIRLQEASQMSATTSECNDTADTSPGWNLTNSSDVTMMPRRRSRPITGLPVRYAAIILGSSLLLLASALFLPFGPATATPIRGLATVFAGSISLGLLLSAGLNRPLFTSTWTRLYVKMRSIVLGVALILTLGTLLGISTLTWFVLTKPPSQFYVSDIVSMTHVDAELALAGKNPYTGDEAFPSALERFPLALGTPLRGPVFGTDYDQPGMEEMATIQRKYVASPEQLSEAFDPGTLHSYPALSFLLYVPWLWVGGTNIVIVNLCVYVAVFAWLIWLAPVGWRRWSALVALAAMPTVVASLIESNEVICVALLLLAWHYRERRWVGAILVGLSCAFKQYAWFFAPFFAIEVVRGQGWRAGFRWGGTALVAFLLPNAPFIIANPEAWLTSMSIPMSGKFFAVGMGIIQLASSHILPYFPQLVYASLELVALGVALWFAARRRESLGAGMLVLALLPLFLAFRSSPNYFAFAPWLALYAANQWYTKHGTRPDMHNGSISEELTDHSIHSIESASLAESLTSAKVASMDPVSVMTTSCGLEADGAFIAAK